MPHQMKVVAAALAAVAGLVDQRADKVDTEPADWALFSRRVQIRRAKRERIERRPIVGKTDSEAAHPPPECHGDASTPGMRSTTMRYGVGEELVENDQKPRPLIIRQTAFVRKLVGKGLEPPELRMLAT
jgi:signal-transduction protein with cAMP-binding, CBS, and nucleotidyltransferase domain